MRSFIAIKIPDLIVSPIVSLQKELQETAVPVRWVKPQNLHVTLLFLGNINPAAAKKVAVNLEAKARKFKPFSLNFNGTGTFPPRGKIRVVWVGIGRGAREMQSLHSMVKTSLAWGNFGDGKNFSPHLTIGRVKDFTKMRDLRLLLEEKRGFATPDFSVNSMFLFKSELTPCGPLYTELQEFKFMP